MRNPLSMIKKPPQLSQAKREAPARALKGLEDAAAAAQDCIWQRVRTVQLAGHVSMPSRHKQAAPGVRMMQLVPAVGLCRSCEGRHGAGGSSVTVRWSLP